MPTDLAGSRTFRVERARDFSSRASAVVDKTRISVALDAEDPFSSTKMPPASCPKPGMESRRQPGWPRNTRDDFRAGQKVRIDAILNNEVLAAQTVGAHNETLF
jgi:hypothetical protein